MIQINGDSIGMTETPDPRKGKHMNAWKSSLAAVLLLVCVEAKTQAQAPSVWKEIAGSAVDAGSKNSGKYYNMTNSFDPLGIAGVYPGYLGAGLSGYGPGAKLSNNYAPWPLSTTMTSTSTGTLSSPAKAASPARPTNSRSKTSSVRPRSRNLSRN